MNPALSFEPLSPVSFLDRSAAVFPERTAVIDGDRRFTYAQLHDRCRRLAGVLAPLANGDPVAVLAPNTHIMLEAHYGAPWAGAPLVTINTRLSAPEVRYILEHSESAVLLHDPQFDDLVAKAIDGMPHPPLIVRAGPGDDGAYEQLLAAAAPTAVPLPDEGALLSINYTSGTTGRPKGVMYQHRGAYLQALAMVTHTQLSTASAYLWTLPMFHCNGWCFPWAVTAAGGTHVCLPKVEASEIWRLIHDEHVTHLCGAPAVLSMVVDAPEAKRDTDEVIRFLTGGAPPSPTLLAAADELRFDVTHLYGLTETYGPSVLCDWHPEWNGLAPEEQSRLRARQGVSNIVGLTARVVANGVDVPADGTTIGEIRLRGNNLMLGYLKDATATAAAAPDGWFRTGDLGVRHPDGYIELRDRSKDVIISGGENITSIEVEQAIASHPAVLEVAVVGAPDDRWGEVPVAYTVLRPDAVATEREIIDHVKDRIARFKAPKRVVFGELPRTSTGKIQKYLLRENERAAGSLAPLASDGTEEEGQ
ncbi:acyl--CoA ligase family protein [Streptomyces doebereineriae]|uniref:Acyl--CoA ligase family protein n=1 Tax=Streptomyces doebereineriae TaxID=3075528 RepID=A0ABU2V1N7_9ACTN|nr:acyl--CoA ligase family protein [Streptomyces sp. DSM 41640]MDT0479462.1 acyl--CoA ligase family protein [Streptomyces sp. DSM 41640]